MNLYENLLERAINHYPEDMEETLIPASPYIPVPATVEQTARLTEKERFYKLAPADERLLDYKPGQFFMVGLPGYGEAPISISSPPGSPRIEMCIRAVGNLTNALHRLRKGDTLWLRGPFGTSFSLDEMKGKDIVFVAGGIGMVPMRSLVKAALNEAPAFGRLTLIYGSKGPDEMLFAEEMDSWREAGLDIRLTIDKPHPGWAGNVGVVTTLIPGVAMPENKTVAVVIGPPVMYKFVILTLRDRNVLDDSIYVSLERRMKCGVGKCGHCQINSVYVCQEGPVFKLSGLIGLPEAL